MCINNNPRLQVNLPTRIITHSEAVTSPRMDRDNVTMVTTVVVDCGSSTPTDATMGPPTVTLGSGSKVTLSILMVVTMLGSLFGNSIVCFIVYQKPAMRSAINLLLANMALANILLSLGCMPFALTTLITGSWVFGVAMCRTIAFLHRLFVCEAVFVLFAISIDRYLIIVQKRDKLTPFRAKLVIGITWCISAALSFPPVIGWGLYRHYDGWIQCTLSEQRYPTDTAYLVLSMTFIFYGPMSILTYTYLCIANTVRKRGNRVHVQNCLDGSITRLGLAVIAHPQIIGVDMSFKTRAFKTILILFLVYLVCWLPYSIGMVHFNLSKTMGTHYLAGNVLLCLGYMNTTVNPCIYCWRIDKFREACQELFPGTCRIFPLLPERTKRRIDPSALYKLKDRSSSV